MMNQPIPCPDELTQDTGRALYRAITERTPSSGSTVVLDLSSTRRMDSLGAAWLVKIAEYAHQHNLGFQWQGETGSVAEFMDMVAPSLKVPPPKPPKREGFLEQIGGGTLAVWEEAKQLFELCIDAIYWTLVGPLEGKGFRWGLLVEEMYQMGVRAVRIVALMNFLMGLIIAMLSAKQVEHFGLQIYVADLLMIAFARELAAVTTAVVISARTGAAITAELATMQVQEEIDALRGMGINVAQYLIAPRLLSLVIVQPILTGLGMIMGVLGGAAWGIFVLDFLPSIWFRETLHAAYAEDMFQGFLKSFFFAVAIVIIGCHNGLRVRGGSRGVGLMTTRAVVMDIFMLIVIDMIFATIFYYILK